MAETKTPPPPPRKALLDAPVIGREPDFLGHLPMDNAVGAIVALTAEVYLLRERLQALEALLTARRVLPSGAVEAHNATAQEREAQQADLAAFTQRVLSELARNRTPVSSVDPRVSKYLKTFDELRQEGKL
jgi:hypothetical protein